MPDLVTLLCPPGAADFPISCDIDQFKPFRADHLDPDSPWLVTMPPHAAEPKIRVGGFFLTRPNAGPSSSGETVRLMHIDGPRSCGWGGVNYEPDEDGVVEVPAEAVAALVESHDFAPAPPKPPAPKKEPKATPKA